MWLSYSKLSCDLFTFKMVLYLRKKGSNVTFSPWINVTFLTCFIFVVVIKHFWDMTSDCSWWFWHWVIYISMRWFCLKFASYLFTTCFMTIITRLPCRYLQGPMSPISRPRGEYHIFNTYFFSKLEAMTSKVTFCMKLLMLYLLVNIQKIYLGVIPMFDSVWDECLKRQDSSLRQIYCNFVSLMWVSFWSNDPFC